MSSESEYVEEIEPPRKIGIKERIQADPGFPITVISTVVNFTLANMLFYGITGNPRAGMLAGLITVPVCAIINILDTEWDYMAWKETKAQRARGVPELLISKKVRYEWEYYEPLREEINRFYGYDFETGKKQRKHEKS